MPWQPPFGTKKMVVEGAGRMPLAAPYENRGRFSDVEVLIVSAET
jgi:hypothetical protein